MDHTCRVSATFVTISISLELTSRVSLGGEVETCEVEEIELGCRAACASQAWEDKRSRLRWKIRRMLSYSRTDGSRGEEGRVAGGWSKDSFEAGLSWDAGQPARVRSGKIRSRLRWKIRRMLSYSRTDGSRGEDSRGGGRRTPSRQGLEVAEII